MGQSHGRVYAVWCDYMDEKNWTPIRNSSKELGVKVTGLEKLCLAAEAVSSGCYQHNFNVVTVYLKHRIS